jgi:hypothetical protein
MTRTTTVTRTKGWADDRIPDGFVNKESAARLLGVSTVTIDRWSRPFDPPVWMHDPALPRYRAPGYPYTLFARDDIDALLAGEKTP